MVAERGLPRWLWISRLAVTLIVVNGLLATDALGAGARICVIDMGSNSFRRIVGSFDQGRYTQHAIERRTLGVGDDVAKHGRISDPKLNEVRKALAGFNASCRKERITSVLAVGTAAFRDAANGPAVVNMAAALGIQMEIATERRESQLAYLAGSLGQDGYAVIDNGSRSIELVARNGAAPRYRVFNLGYRVAYERFFANAGDPLRATRAFADRLRAEATQAPFMKGRKNSSASNSAR